MADKKGENVKIPWKYIQKLRKNKKETGVPMATFICQAIDEKLNPKK
jgi:hypothetical protein